MASDPATCRAYCRGNGRPRGASPRAGEEGGFILIVVVVLLMLLAILGTAYLATSRADRLAVSANSNRSFTSPLRDPVNLEQISRGAGVRLENELIGDLFNLQPGFLLSRQGDRPLSVTDQNAIFAAFRQTIPEPTALAGELGSSGMPFYENYDAPGRADPWLSSLLPAKDETAEVYRWPWISAPLVGESRRGSTYFGAPVAREVLPGVDVESFFADPRDLSMSGYSRTWADQTGSNPPLTARNDVEIRAIAMLRSDSHSEPKKPTRVYPGFRYKAVLGGAGIETMAADADGDGIADSGMMPIALRPSESGIERYLDRANGVVYFVGYRIVDNSAQLNMSTALTVQGDIATDALFNVKISSVEDPGANPELRNALAFERTGAPGVGYSDSPNLGFFRSNVGLLELFRETLRPYSNSTGTIQPLTLEPLRFLDARFPMIVATPASNADGDRIRELARQGDPNDPSVSEITAPNLVLANRNDTTGGTSGGAFRYRSFGDLLEQQLLSRSATGGVLMKPVSAAASDPVTLLLHPLVKLSVEDSASLAAKGGTLLDNGTTPSIGEAALAMTLRMAAPNFTTSPDSSWEWFPPAEIKLWYEWTKSFQASRVGDPDAEITTYGKIGLLDFGQTDDARVVVYQPPAASGLAPLRMPKSIRTLLTTYNGITSAAPRRRDSSPLSSPAGLPWGMPAYGPNIANGEYPAARVSAATGTKEQLFRAYWSSMVQSTVSGRAVVDRKHPSGGGADTPYDAFSPSDRHPSDVGTGGATIERRLDEPQMALIRAAVAACNTIDLRDSDQDITAMTVGLGHVEPGNLSTDKIFARVFGTEKQVMIGAVAIDDDPSGPVSVYVELFNPSDEALDLTGYRIGVVQRRPKNASTPTEPVTLATGTVSVPSAITTQRTIAPAGTLLQPGGYVIITNCSSTDPLPPGISGKNNASTLEQMRLADPGIIITDSVDDLRQVRGPLGAQRDRELVLMRTRRADGQPTTENPALADIAAPGFKRPPFSESTALDDEDGLLTLVPVDAVDLRTLEYPNVAVRTGSGQRYLYVRSTVPYAAPGVAGSELERPVAWKCFYSGQFYDLRPVNSTDPAAATQPVAPEPLVPPTTGWAWREYPVSQNDSAPEQREGRVVLGAAREIAGSSTRPAGPDTAVPYLAPTIPTQNFKPYATAGSPAIYEHPSNKFPYGSPFARNGDVLAVPFVGSYKIYRIPAAFTGTTVPTLYEYVPLPMDAWAAAPVADVTNPSVGRFDPRGGVDTSSNEWADDLFDFVTARQAPAAVYFPDVPRIDTTDGINDPAAPATDQDGPVNGFNNVNRTSNGINDPAFSVPWVTWTKVSDGSKTSERRSGELVTNAEVSSAGLDSHLLIQGIGNINTMPAIVRRMLPFAVNDMGQVDTAVEGTSVASNRQRARAAVIDDVLGALQKKDITTVPFGITSVAAMSQIDHIKPVVGSPPTLTAAQRMMAGDLQPYHRPSPDLDFIYTNRDMTRLSNLVSQRSDVFTVYITVQAWTWAGSTQADDTRLVGETRSAFIVDRSRINETAFRPKDLVVLPLDCH